VQRAPTLQRPHRLVPLQAEALRRDTTARDLLPCRLRAAHLHRTTHTCSWWRLLEALESLPRKALSSERGKELLLACLTCPPLLCCDVGRRQLTRILLLPIIFVRL
jgi:hypothetical protein